MNRMRHVSLGRWWPMRRSPTSRAACRWDLAPPPEYHRSIGTSEGPVRWPPQSPHRGATPVRAKTGIARRSSPARQPFRVFEPAVILRRKTQLRELSDREQRNCGRPTGIRIQICSLEESRLFRYTVGPLVSPARLELAYSNYGDPLRGRGRYGDLREQVFVPCL